MYLQIQYPMFDGRPLLASPSTWSYPNWSHLDVSGQYVRKFGKIVSRRRYGVEGLAAETFFCQLRNKLKAGEDWASPFPAKVSNADQGRRAGLGGGQGRLSWSDFAKRRFVRIADSSWERVRNVIVESLGVEESRVIPTAKLVADLGAGIFDLARLTNELHYEFHVEITHSAAKRMVTVKNVVNFLLSRGRLEITDAAHADIGAGMSDKAAWQLDTDWEPSPGMKRNYPRFVVRRLFFDGLYSGKLDLGFFLPIHLFVDDASSINEEGLGGIVDCITNLLGRTIRLNNANNKIGALGLDWPSEYAKATSSNGQDSTLVRLNRPTMYAEIITPKGRRWGEAPNWHRTALHYADVYYTRFAFLGREFPLFVARIDADQIKNRARHLRIATLKFFSEISNTQTLLSAVAEGKIILPENSSARPFVHSHLKHTLKFFRGAGEQPHITSAIDIVRNSAGQESLGSVVAKLSELDSYWDASKRRELLEIVMGDKVGGDKVGGDKVGGDKVTAETGGAAVGRGARVGGNLSTKSSVEAFDLKALAAELERVGTAMRDRSADAVAQVDPGIVEEAARQAARGNESNVVSLLKKVGGGFLDVAKDVGAKIAIAFASAKLGIGG
jgi:acyl carrier protein